MVVHYRLGTVTTRPSPSRRARRGALLALVLAVPLAAGCTVATNHPDGYELSTEANVLDGYVRQAMDDPGDRPIIVVVEDGGEERLQIPDSVDPDVLAVARCIYDGISHPDDGIPFDDWKDLDAALGDDPAAVAESAAENTGSEASSRDRTFVALQEIRDGCQPPG